MLISISNKIINLDKILYIAEEPKVYSSHSVETAYFIHFGDGCKAEITAEEFEKFKNYVSAQI